MSNDLKRQIREYATLVEDGQDPVTVEEVRLRLDRRDETEPVVGLGPSVESRLPMRRPWPAVVAAVVVLIIFGVFVFVFPGDSPPPADTLPDPADRETGYYVPADVPEGFVLQDVDTLGESELLYLREFDDTWIPSDGGFAVYGIHGSPFGLPEDPDGYLDGTLDAVPGSVEIDVDGRRGIFFETEFTQDGLAAPLVWVLGTDDQGGIFEIVAVGMNRGEVLAVAEGVDRISGEDVLELGSQITWDVRIDVVHSGFNYSPPGRVTDLADDVEVAVGVDLLASRLAHAGQETTVITTDDGEIVESFGQAIRSASADLYLAVPQDGLDDVLEAYPGSAELAPHQSEARVERYIDRLEVSSVVSEDPYVVQAAPGSEPRFDTSELGEELPLVPATSGDVLPRSMFDGPNPDRPAATQDRPVVVIGTVDQPGSDWPPVTALVWFTVSGVTCEGTTSDGGVGSGCGFEIGSRFGIGGGSTTSDEDGELVSADVSYVVPLETSVVQILTASQSYWQQPVGGYGVIPYGDTVEQPRSIVAYDADGNEIGSWSMGSR